MRPNVLASAVAAVLRCCLTFRSGGLGGREAFAAVRLGAARLFQEVAQEVRAAGPCGGQHHGVLHPHRPGLSLSHP
jgi:hypothetical protein